MNHEDRAGAVGNARFDRGGTHVDHVRFGVSEHRDVVLGDQSQYGAVVGDRADDDLIAGVEPERRREHRQCGRAAGRGYAVLHAVRLREGGLEALDHVAGQPAVHHFLEVLHAVGPHDARIRVREQTLQVRECRCSVLRAFESTHGSPQRTCLPFAVFFLAIGRNPCRNPQHGAPECRRVGTPFRPVGYQSSLIRGHRETRVTVPRFSYVALQAADAE